MVGTQIRVGPPVGEFICQKGTKVDLMNGRAMRYWVAIVLAMAGIGLAGCNPMTSGRQGRGVMFESSPQIYKQEVYYRGRAIGKILEQKTGNGSVHKVTIQLSPDHMDKADSNWVFFVDNGRLTAFRIAPLGKPTTQGDNLCGFGSKAALNWFRFKTLLTNRIYKARQIADTLTRRFG
jgi:hypothetical protein